MGLSVIMELFVRRLMSCGSEDTARMEIVVELLRIRRERQFSPQQLSVFVTDASEVIAESWPESPLKRMILDCLNNLTEDHETTEN